MNEENGQALVKQLGSTAAKFFVCDVLDTESVRAAVQGTADWIKQTGKTLGGVIPAAGVSTPATVCSPPFPYSAGVKSIASLTPLADPGQARRRLQPGRLRLRPQRQPARHHRPRPPGPRAPRPGAPLLSRRRARRGPAHTRAGTRRPRGSAMQRCAVPALIDDVGACACSIFSSAVAASAISSDHRRLLTSSKDVPEASDTSVK
jgi:hypothetical protein